jgi:hypothetical protein
MMMVPYGIIASLRLSRKKQARLLKARNSPPLSRKRSIPQYIVNLTSYGERAWKTAPYAVCSLFNQTVLPDRIIIWLAHGTPISPVLSELQKKGLEIRYCEDIKSYKKLIPALREFPDDVLITADDDVYYPENWFELMKTSYTNDPARIYAHRLHEIKLDKDKNIMPYREWRMEIKTVESSRRLFPTGIGGVLYPPHSLDNRVLDIDGLLKLAPTTDDIWFWAMAKLKGTEHALINNGCSHFEDIERVNEGLYIKNVYGNNDVQIRNIIKYFPELTEVLK